MYSLLIVLALGHLLFLALQVTSGGSFPRPLSAKEERECLERIRHGDADAKNKLIEHNLRLVAHIIKRYYASLRDQEDLISIGTIGLIKAAGTFDNEKGARFATYASRCIENEILMHFRGLKKTAQDVFISDLSGWFPVIHWDTGEWRERAAPLGHSPLLASYDIPPLQHHLI